MYSEYCPIEKKCTYLEVFKELKSLAVELNRTFEPTRILTDFEPSIIEAISTEASINSKINYKYFLLCLVSQWHS